MKAIKYSKQREAIKAFLLDNNAHPTADTVYAHVRETYPNISLGTVYRNLNLLAESGEVRKLSFTDGADRFDYDTRPHDHYVCRCCGRVYDLPASSRDTVLAGAAELAAGSIEAYDLVFYGVCHACEESREQTA